MGTDDLSPLLETRNKLDNALQALTDKMAIIRKRRDALQTAIDVMRSSDDEVEELLRNVKPRYLPKHVDDDSTVENTILSLLQAGPMDSEAIRESLFRLNVKCTENKVKMLLRTSPSIERIGERNYSRYKVRNANDKTTT